MEILNRKFQKFLTVSKWLRRCSRRVKRLLQAWQGYGLSPVWHLKCLFRSAFLFTVCVQNGHLKRTVGVESKGERERERERLGFTRWRKTALQYKTYQDSSRWGKNKTWHAWLSFSVVYLFVLGIFLACKSKHLTLGFYSITSDYITDCIAIKVKLCYFMLK